MISDPTPRTLRDEIADIVRTAIVATYPETFGECADLAASALLASFDIRPHNEPATIRRGASQSTTNPGFVSFDRTSPMQVQASPRPEVPEGMTAEKLRRCLRLVQREREYQHRHHLPWDIEADLARWADEIAARDVGGDSPAEETK